MLAGLCAFLFNTGVAALEHLGIYGRVYPIKEESILERLKHARLPNIRREDIEKKLIESAEIDLGLPVAKSLRIYEENLILKAQKDLTVGGKIIARKGETIDALEKMTLSRVYVFLEDYMIRDFINFARKYPTTFLITKGNVLEARMRYPDLTIYMAVPIIVDRLGITAVPTLVYQSENKLVKVEVPWAEGKALLPF